MDGEVDHNAVVRTGNLTLLRTAVTTAVSGNPEVTSDTAGLTEALRILSTILLSE